MSQQNIFDNEAFFEGYKAIRDADGNANDLFEIPALFSLLPPLTDCRVLDLGCGYGEHCEAYVGMGARRVVGIDISDRMLSVARAEHAHPRITYLHLPMESVREVEGPFDVVVSSLALHYVEDFAALAADVYSLLAEGGVFVFSQEHPLNTSYSGGERWTVDETGAKRYLNLADYGVEGRRTYRWLVDGVECYHRTFSTIVNDLVAAGFAVERVLEPLPTEAVLEVYPKYKSMYHMPYFLVVKAIKR